jgi:hypothetical protein
MNTTIGGLYSLFIRIAYYYAILYFIRRMVNAEENHYEIVDNNYDWNHLGIS